MQFEPSQTKETLGPFFVDNALADIPIFGPGGGDVASIADMSMEAHTSELVVEAASIVPLPDSFAQAATLAEKLKALRKYIWGITHPELDEDDFEVVDHPNMLAKLEISDPEEVSTHSSRSLHESLMKSTMETAGFPKSALLVLDHIMLIRAKENYLLNCRTNRDIVDDDPWLKGVWGWIEGDLNLLFRQVCLR